MHKKDIEKSILLALYQKKEDAHKQIAPIYADTEVDLATIAQVVETLEQKNLICDAHIQKDGDEIQMISLNTAKILPAGEAFLKNSL